MNKEQALHSFFSSFGKAYEENSVPEDAGFPRITYEVITDSFGAVVSITASLWYRDSSWNKITQKVHEIADAVSEGKYVKYDDGAILIMRGTPFAQNMSDASDKLIKRKVLLFDLEYISLR